MLLINLSSVSFNVTSYETLVKPVTLACKVLKEITLFAVNIRGFGEYLHVLNEAVLNLI